MMAAHFVRRIFGGMATWLFATFALYSLLIFPGIPRYQPIEWCCPHVGQQQFYFYAYGGETTYALDKSWPSNYLSWMWEPQGVITNAFLLRTEPTQNGALPAKTVEFSRSGLLRGDFGVSLQVKRNAPTLMMYGINLSLFLGILSAGLLSSMFVAIRQRRNRQPVRTYSAAQARVLNKIEPLRVLG